MHVTAIHAAIFLIFVTIGWGQNTTKAVPAPAEITRAPAASTTGSKPGGKSPAAGTSAEKKPGTVVPEPAATPMAAMNAAAVLPIGVPSYDVRMPEFDEVRLVSRMRVEKLVRIDDNQLDLLNMYLERYLPAGGLDYVVTIQRGFYDLKTGRLVSSSPTRLRGREIDMYGEGCVYAKDDDVIKILGKVTSYIYLKDKRNEKPTTAPAPAVPAPPSIPANP